MLEALFTIYRRHLRVNAYSHGQCGLHCPVVFTICELRKALSFGVNITEIENSTPEKFSRRHQCLQKLYFSQVLILLNFPLYKAFLSVAG